MKSLLLIIITILIIYLIALGMDKQGRVDCELWNHEATIYTDYYVTEWQSEQCKALGVPLTASILVNFEDGSSRTFTQSELDYWYK